MNRSIQCTRNDCDECIGCDCTCHPVEQTWERAHTEMMEYAERRADQILTRMKHRGYLLKADEYGAVIEYNGACHCHPEPKQFTIPAQWLFADDWQSKVDEYMRGLEEKRLAAEAELEKLREARERKDLERLQAKYRTV